MYDGFPSILMLCLKYSCSVLIQKIFKIITNKLLFATIPFPFYNSSFKMPIYILF